MGQAAPVVIEARPGVDIERLRSILSDESVSAAHRIADRHVRLMIMNRSLSHSKRLSAIAALGLFGPSYRAEAAAMLRQIVDDDSEDSLNRIHAAGTLNFFDGADRAYGASFLKRVAEGDGRYDDRIIAVRDWWRMSPHDRDEIVAVAQKLVDHEEIMSMKKSLCPNSSKKF